MGDSVSKLAGKECISREVRKHVETALAKAGPHRARPRRFCRFWFGIADTFFAIWRGRSVTLPDFVKNEETVLFRCVPSDRLLVVAPPIRGDERSANVRPLVVAALSRGWSVAVHSRDRKHIFDEHSLRVCVEKARTTTGAAASKTCVVGLSIGAYEACKARLPYPLVSISNGYDLETAKQGLNRFARRYVTRLASSIRSGNLSCVEELLCCSRPTLLINSRNDPVVPKQCLDIGDSIAHANPHVASVTTARGGHLGFVGGDGKRWAYDVALEFLQSVTIR
jgi:predicted alpha/beta-fold hydrolase